METVRSVIEISGTLYFSIPKKWSRKKGLKKGDKMLVIANDKILAEGIKVIKTEEYYTPEWLSELVIQHSVNVWEETNSTIAKKTYPRILDPACGSGTFLTNSITLFKKWLKKTTPQKALDIILDHVMGADINPLAITIARANYVIALGDLLKKVRKNITIPVFLSDTIKIPDVRDILSIKGQIKVQDFITNGIHLQIPTSVSMKRDVFGKVLSSMREACKYYKERKGKASQNERRNESKNFFKRNVGSLLKVDELVVLNNTLDILMGLIDKNEDSVWLFMINNLFASNYFSKTKFDIITGNPPWITMRAIRNEDYQNFLKRQIFKYELLDSKDVELYTQMEMASLFFCRTCDLYLKKTGGVIGFLMKTSFLDAARQLIKFQSFQKPLMSLSKILNFKEIKGEIFSLPVCALIAVKGEQTSFPVTSINFDGKLEAQYRNVKLSELKGVFNTVKTKWSPPVTPITRKSPYYKHIVVGAALYPRCFWFIDFDVHLEMGMGTNPLVKSSEEVLRVGKRPWKDIDMQGKVESAFIFATLLGKDLIPFGSLKPRPIVIPAKTYQKEFKLLDVQELRAQGYKYMAKWVEEVQDKWYMYSTDKSKKNFPKAVNRLDYQRLLTNQGPHKRFIMLYNGCGANSFAHVLDRTNLPSFKINDITFTPQNFIADYTAIIYKTSDTNVFLQTYIDDPSIPLDIPVLLITIIGSMIFAGT